MLKKELRYDELLKLYGRSAEAKVINVEVSGGSFNRYKSGVSFCTFQLRDIETSQVFIRSGECPSNTSETISVTYIPENIPSGETMLAIRKKPIWQRGVLVFFGIWFVTISGILLFFLVKRRASRAPS